MTHTSRILLHIPPRPVSLNCDLTLMLLSLNCWEEGDRDFHQTHAWKGYDFDALNELEHAWAVTVHKAQGSEYRAVILALSGTSQLLMTRSVLYTGVTRARELLILVGDDTLAIKMIDNYRQARRYTALRVRLRSLCGL